MDKRYSLTKSDDYDKADMPIIRRADAIQNQAIELSEQKREGWLASLFPDRKQMEIVKGELALVKTEYEFRRRALVVLRETQFQALTETCNQYLIRDKAARRADTAMYLLKKKEEMIYELDKIFEQFMKLMEAKYKSMENEKIDLLRQVRQDQLEKEINDYMELQNKLINNFQKLIDEKV